MTEEFAFKLIYKLPTSQTLTDELVDNLYANGCDDALIGTVLPSQITLDFIREAENASSAIQSANQDVLKTVPQAQLVGWVTDYCAGSY